MAAAPGCPGHPLVTGSEGQVPPALFWVPWPLHFRGRPPGVAPGPRSFIGLGPVQTMDGCTKETLGRAGRDGGDSRDGSRPLSGSRPQASSQCSLSWCRVGTLGPDFQGPWPD
jgi:hypothetical protein